MKTVNKKYELVPIGDLVEHPQNPRRGDMESIVDSVATNNVYGAAIVQRSTRHILAGNHRVRAARQQGKTEFPVIWVDVDDGRALAILLADNKTSDDSREMNDEQRVADLLAQVNSITGSLAGTGYTADDYSGILADLAPPPPPGDDDEAEDAGEVAVKEHASDASLRFGEVTGVVDGEKYGEWEYELRKSVGFDARRVKKEILKRLGLNTK